MEMGVRQTVCDELTKLLRAKPDEEAVDWVMTRATELEREYPELRRTWCGALSGAMVAAVHDCVDRRPIVPEEQIQTPVRRKCVRMEHRDAARPRSRKRSEGQEHLNRYSAIRYARRNRDARRWMMVTQ